MERAFARVFLRSLSRALKGAVSDSEVQKQFSQTIREGVASGAFSSDLIEKNLDEVTISCLGALSADVSLRSMYEREEDPLRELKRMITEELVKIAGDNALNSLLKSCQMGQATSQFGEEKLEDIVEKISTQDIYLRPEFEESIVSLKQIILEAINE
jgi:hypothetical protein